MKYVANLMDASLDPVQWARRREDQGWDILSVADHFFTPTRSYPHVWVTVSAVAMATSRALVTTAFVNNLLRNPVEVAQAALMMQSVSGGRFELGLGAGWAKDEILAAGIPYPEPRDRAGAFIESVQIVRSLLQTQKCSFSGLYYEIDVPNLGPVCEVPPPLVCSVGGYRTIREVTPYSDKVEIKASSPSTRGGAVDLAAMAEIPDQHLIDLIAKVRAVKPDIGIGMFVFCNVGDDERTRQLSSIMGEGLYSRFYGPPEKVAEGLAWLGDVGISRCQISAIDDASLDRLAPVLFG
jgi:alkanesulfonate monooxygenase SsuD/methylene tetrahydromethanopterin reductase-like flavin-dependent oxidoreductase (luciferase family)